MCDYSLMGNPSRLAVEGEELVVHRFNTGSLGLRAAAPAPKGFRQFISSLFNATQPVVCVPPGARLMLRDIPSSFREDFGVGSEEEVIFTQTTATVNNYRDAVRFNNGRQVLLQQLRTGQRVRVLDLSLADAVEPVLVETRDPRPTLIRA